MQTLLGVSWSAIVMSSIAVTAVAVSLWLRDVLRERDTDGVEPSPLSKRSAIYSMLALCVFIGIRLARGESVSFLFAGFTAVFIGFALSAGWYLLERRGTGLRSRGPVDTLSAVVAASFGALSALTPPPKCPAGSTRRRTARTTSLSSRRRPRRRTAQVPPPPRRGRRRPALLDGTGRDQLSTGQGWDHLAKEGSQQQRGEGDQHDPAAEPGSHQLATSSTGSLISPRMTLSRGRCWRW